MDGLVPFSLMKGAIFLRLEQWEIVMEWPWMYYPWLVLDGVEDLIDWELQQSEVFHWSIVSERTWWENQEYLILVSRLPRVSILSVVESLVRRLWVASTLAWFGRVVGGSLHHLFQLDVRLSSGECLVHFDNVVLQEVLVWGWVTCSLLMNASIKTSSPQSETLASWLRKKLMYDLRLSPCLILTERRWWLFLLAFWWETYWAKDVPVIFAKLGESKIVRNRTGSRLHLSGWRENWDIWLDLMGVDHQLILNVSNVLNWITHFRVIVKSGSQEFPQELALLDLFRERRIVDFCHRKWVALQLGLHDLWL